jgi:hypothetical protein
MEPRTRVFSMNSGLQDHVLSAQSGPVLAALNGGSMRRKGKLRMSTARETALRALWGTDEFLDTTGLDTRLIEEDRTLIR